MARVRTPDNPTQGDAAAAPKNFSLPEELKAKVIALRDRGVSSNTDVLRVALFAFDDLTQLHLSGEALLIQGDDGLDLPFDPFTRLCRENYLRLPPTEPMPLASLDHADGALLWRGAILVFIAPCQNRTKL